MVPLMTRFRILRTIHQPRRNIDNFAYMQVLQIGMSRVSKLEKDSFLYNEASICFHSVHQK